MATLLKGPAGARIHLSSDDKLRGLFVMPEDGEATVDGDLEAFFDSRIDAGKLPGFTLESIQPEKPSDAVQTEAGEESGAKAEKGNAK